MNNGWYGFDLDGTLAEYGKWQGAEHIGPPIKPMVDLVKSYLAGGFQVKIFTARVGPQKDVNEAIRAREAIAKWTKEHIGQELEATATKDFAMICLYDDRCCHVETNTGIILG